MEILKYPHIVCDSKKGKFYQHKETHLIIYIEYQSDEFFYFWGYPSNEPDVKLNLYQFHPNDNFKIFDDRITIEEETKVEEDTKVEEINDEETIVEDKKIEEINVEETPDQETTNDDIEIIKRSSELLKIDCNYDVLFFYFKNLPEVKLAKKMSNGRIIFIVSPSQTIKFILPRCFTIFQGKLSEHTIKSLTYDCDDHQINFDTEIGNFHSEIKEQTKKLKKKEPEINMTFPINNIKFNYFLKMNLLRDINQNDLDQINKFIPVKFENEFPFPYNEIFV